MAVGDDEGVDRFGVLSVGSRDCGANEGEPWGG